MAVLSLNDISKSFGDKVVLSHVTFSIQKNDKVAIVGDNGEGKSTLLKIITKQIPKDSGNLYIDPHTTLGYLSQEVISNPNHTLIEEMETAFLELKSMEKEMEQLLTKIAQDSNDKDIHQYTHLEEQYRFKGGYEYHYQIETLLNKFGFNSSFYQRKIHTFSGGEKHVPVLSNCY